jgi:hypothetical protein
MAKRADPVPVLGSLSWSLILVVYFVSPEAGDPDYLSGYDLAR